MAPLSPSGVREHPPAQALPDRPGGLPTDREAKRRTVLCRIRFRRALALVLMTLVLPGSAQLVAGSKRVGRIAIRTCVVFLVSVVLLLLLGLLSRHLLFTLFSSTWVLALVRVGLIVLAVGWAFLFVDAWRLGRPLELQQRQRLTLTGLNAALSLTVAGGLLFAAHIVDVQRDFISVMFGDGAATAATEGRYNILLVGGDSGTGREGLRTDALTVASIDAETGRTILFGLPRNLTNFPFPEGSLMAEHFPHGYSCSTCELSSLSTWAHDHPDLFTGSADPGMDATIQGVEGITGLRINYHVMLDLAGFRELVAAMGGLVLNVRDDIPIGGGEQGQIGTIPAGVRRLDGYQVLWFARSRMAADDYSRMARQKCVMSAMVQQLSPQTVITRFSKLADAGQALIDTDLPASELDTFADLALKARTQKMSTVSFVPPVIDTAAPDTDKIRDMVETATDRSEAEGTGEAAAAGKGFNRRHRAPSTGGSVGSMAEGYEANHSDDLAQVC
jgi:polyisoprenyl-teichoic acid--peptidoglycan teichoic acid transferase